MRKRKQSWESNRDHVRIARVRGSWCFGCDQGLIRDGGKCRVCGVPMLPKRSKK